MKQSVRLALAAALLKIIRAIRQILAYDEKILARPAHHLSDEKRKAFEHRFVRHMLAREIILVLRGALMDDKVTELAVAFHPTHELTDLPAYKEIVDGDSFQWVLSKLQRITKESSPERSDHFGFAVGVIIRCCIYDNEHGTLTKLANLIEVAKVSGFAHHLVEMTTRERHAA